MADVDILDYDGLKTKDFNTLLSDIQGNIQDIYAPNGEEINFTSSSPDGQITNILAEIGTVARELLTETYNSCSPSNCSGAVQDTRYQINYLYRKGGTYTLQNIDITIDRTVTLQGLDANYDNPNASSYTVSDNAGNLWFLVETVTVTDTGQVLTSTGSVSGTGTATVTGTGTVIATLQFRAKEIGQVIPTIGTITTQNTIVAGVLSVNNSVSPSRIGEEQETDEEFRIRRDRSVAVASQNNADAIISELLQLDDVTDCYVWVNNTNSEDATETDAHTLWAIVEGGNQNDIAQVLYKNIGGSETRGTIEVETPTIAGQVLTMRFDKPKEIEVYVKFNIKVTGNKNLINEDGVKKKLVEITNYNIGQDISSAELTANASYSLKINGGENIAYVTDLEISLTNEVGSWTNLIQVSTKADKFKISENMIFPTIVEVNA